jgi:hypothetical protein
MSLYPPACPAPRLRKQGLAAIHSCHPVEVVLLFITLQWSYNKSTHLSRPHPFTHSNPYTPDRPIPQIDQNCRYQ